MTNAAIHSTTIDDHVHLCPRCDSSHFVDYNAPPELARRAIACGVYPPALSRFDNETDICSHCGTEEALQDYAHLPLTGPSDWPLVP